MKKVVNFLFLLVLFIPLVACSYTGRNAQVVRTQWDENTKDGNYYIIGSVEELNNYITEGNENRLSQYVESYDESFFEEKSLVLVLISEGSGSVSHKLKDVKFNGDVVDITIKRNVPEIGTCDMAETTIIFEVSKEEANTIKDVNLIQK